jgi:hypothetical protein
MVRLYLFCIKAEDDYRRVAYSPARLIVCSQATQPRLAPGDHAWSSHAGPERYFSHADSFF